MEYVIPTLAVVIGIMLLVLVANARRLHRSGLAMREDIDRIRRQAPQAPGPPAVAGAAPVQPEQRPPVKVAPIAPVPLEPPAAPSVAPPTRAVEASVPAPAGQAAPSRQPAPGPPPAPSPQPAPSLKAAPGPQASPSAPAAPGPQVAPKPQAAPGHHPPAVPTPPAAPSRLTLQTVVLGYNANPQDLKRRFEVREFAVANMQAMSGDPGVKPVYRPVETGKGECWLIPVGGGVSCAVPLPRPTYNLGWFQAARMDRVFSYKGSTEGYRKAEVVKPAIFRETGQDGMVELVEQGILELREAEEEKEPPAAATPEPAAPPDEATAIAVRYQANTERLYSALDGVRVSVANIDALNQNPTAAPVFVPNTFGAFWVVGGRFLVPRPASLDNLSEMRPAPTKFFDCTADGAGEAPQKNVLVRAASLRTADAGWALEDRGAIRLASGENDWQGAIEEIVRLYRSGAEGLRKRYNVVPFGVTNASELEANRSANPKFGPLAEGRYWLLEGGARPCYAVPAPGLAIDDRLIRSAGFLALFGVAGYQTGRTYRRIELVRPAGLDSWRVVVSGEIKLGPAEGDPEPETAPAPAPASQPAEPQKAETPDEPRPLVGVKAVHAKMAELFNQDPGAFRERFSPTRFGVTNLGKFRSQPKADPAFGPKRNGDYWLVATGPYANSRYACVVPYPGIEVDAETFRHLRKVFNCMGYQAGRRYSGVRLVLPAVVKEMPAEGWNIVKTGIIELTKGEPDVDVD